MAGRADDTRDAHAAAPNTGRQLLVRSLGMMATLALAGGLLWVAAAARPHAGAGQLAGGGLAASPREAPTAASSAPRTTPVVPSAASVFPSPAVLLRRERVIYLVRSAGQAQQVQAGLGATGSGGGLPPDVSVVVAPTAAQVSALAQGLALDNVDRELAGLPAARVLDLR